MDSQDHHRRAIISFLLAALVHVIALYYFALGLREKVPRDADEYRGEIFFITRKAVKSPSDTVETLPKSNSAMRESSVHSSLNSKRSVSHDTEITVTAPIDWPAEAKFATASQLNELEKAAKQKQFAASDRPPGLPLPKRAERSDIPWDRLHGKRAGLTDEGLFFVKLSKKCMIITVFLVCGFGGDIRPEGELFENLPAKLDAAREREVP